MSADQTYCLCNNPTNWEMINYHEFCCDSSCPLCVGPTIAACMANRAQTDFVVTGITTLHLPFLFEKDGAVCYEQRIPNPTCNPLTEVVTGTINSDTDGLHPTTEQCYEILSASWPYVEYWFGNLFQDFSPPPKRPLHERYKVETVLWLWILQYGPHALTTDQLWIDLVATFNKPSLDWTQLLAWTGATQGYSPDGVATKSFPASLGVLASSSPAVQLFSQSSKVCNDMSCALPEQCQQISTTNFCR